MFLLIKLVDEVKASFGSFNTSHVSINPGHGDSPPRRLLSFNTSHVSINHSGQCYGKSTYGGFNTSHVSINLVESY